MRQLIFVDQELSSHKTEDVFYDSYSCQATGQGLRTSLQYSAQYLPELVHEIQKHPKNLNAHVQRIFCCYRDNLSAPLYAALVDFLIVLNKRGKAISRRMIGGTLSKLSPRQGALLKAVLTGEINDISVLEGNGYSVFCRGLSGTVKLIEKLDERKEHFSDPLRLARDAVEYSQLEDAMLILERAIEEQPQPLELHTFLLELYQSTHNRTRFETVFVRLQDLGILMSDLPIRNVWELMKEDFELELS